jgi:phosphate transport system permease protein
MYLPLNNKAPLTQLRHEALLVCFLRGIAFLSGAIVLLILGFLLWETFPVLHHIGLSRFFHDPAWFPASGQFNLVPMLWGTVAITCTALLIATPLGIFSAVFCQYYAPPLLAKIYRHFIQLLAGIPSVVYGFWGLVVLVPILGRIYPPGPSWLAGSLILALMILPTITLVSISTLAAVPSHYLRACAALGLGQWATVSGVVFAVAKKGLFTGVLLAAGRAIGETMAVLMVSGNVVQIPSHLFTPVRTLTANIALEMAYAVDDHRSALFANGLLLMFMILIIVLFAEILRRGYLYD